MSAMDPARPDPHDDVDAAYVQARSLVEDGPGPSPSVRDNVLAAAGEVAAQARTRAAAAHVAPPPSPVAPSVAAVGRGRPMAVNLSSWRLRSGALLGVALLVGLATSRFDANRRSERGEQVAAASIGLAAPPAERAHDDLPPLAGDRPLHRAPPAASPMRAPHHSDREVIVAQAEPSLRAPAAAPTPDVRAEAREAPPPAAPHELATMPAMPPSIVSRRAPVAASPAVPSPTPPSGPRGGLAQASLRGAETGGVPAGIRRARGAAPRDDAGARPATASASLQVAADHGDLVTLETLLSDPATRVDAPDAAGRTALLHAVLAQQAGAVRMLLEAGADPLQADIAGLTPRAAARAGPSAVIAALLGAPR